MAPLNSILFKLRIRHIGRVRIEQTGKKGTQHYAQTRLQTRNKLGTFTANRFPTDALTIYLVLFYAKSFAMSCPSLLPLPFLLSGIFELKIVQSEEKYQRGVNGSIQQGNGETRRDYVYVRVYRCVV